MSDLQSPAQTDAQEAIDWLLVVASSLFKSSGPPLPDEINRELARRAIERLRKRGLAIVPVEPTGEMVYAAMYIHAGEYAEQLAAQYAAMLAARPKALR